MRLVVSILLSGVIVKNQRIIKTETMSKKPIDYVTVERLDYLLKMVGISLEAHILDRIIDFVEIIEDNGENFNRDDVEAILSGFGNPINVESGLESIKRVRS